jgi:MoxR-like ATPase
MSREKLDAIEKEMRTQFINRNDVIRGIILAHLSEEHMLQVGAPGTVKSGLSTRFGEYISASHFEWLLTQFTTPEEIVGTVDLESLKAGVFKRVTTNKLPEAQTAFLDEIFKGSSAILNTLLKMLGPERTFHNNGGAVRVPLLSMIAASNELPEEDEGLNALYDRLLLRYHVTYLDQVEQFRDLMYLNEEAPRYVEPMTVDELKIDVAAVKTLPFSEDAYESLQMLWEQMREHGMFYSDRRYRKLMKVMAAQAWLDGETSVTADSLIVAENILWDKPDQIRDCKQIVRMCVNPYAARAQEIREAALEAMTAINQGDIVIKDEVLQVAQQLTQMSDELRRLNSTKQQVVDVVEWIDATRMDLMNRLMKGDIGSDPGDDRSRMLGDVASVDSITDKSGRRIQ